MILLLVITKYASVIHLLYYSSLHHYFSLLYNSLSNNTHYFSLYIPSSSNTLAPLVSTIGTVFMYYNEKIYFRNW